MKKWIIGSLVGAIIIFAWQFLSWTMIGIHSGEEKYASAQDQVLSTLSSSNLEDGMYMLPNTQPGATMQEQQNLMQQNEGKPWARIVYVKSMTTSMTTPIIIRIYCRYYTCCIADLNSCSWRSAQFHRNFYRGYCSGLIQFFMRTLYAA